MLQERAPSAYWTEGWVGPESPGRFREDKNMLALPELYTRTVQHTA